MRPPTVLNRENDYCIPVEAPHLTTQINRVSTTLSLSVTLTPTITYHSE